MEKIFGQMFEFETKYSLFFDKSQIGAIIQSVRNIVLEWLLKLEEDGISGENKKFSNDEKNIANEKNYTTNNFYGNVLNS